MNDHLGCGHCGLPLDLCDCGVDTQIVYQTNPVELRRLYRDHTQTGAGAGWLVVIGAVGALMGLRVLIFGW